MNFFEHQHQARKSTHLLVFLFAAAVICIIGAVTALVTVVFITEPSGGGGEPQFFSDVFIKTAMPVAPLVTLVIGAVSLMRIFTLSGEGRKVALYVGALSLDPGSQDLNDRKLQNIVEEMSIASGVPVPEIYVMRDEMGINAFAAGTVPSQAAVGVTQGALETLTRDELQGVIAHEFSHIFNGDMKLNVHLMGLLGGIQFLTTAGRGILEGMARGRRSSSKKKDGAGAILLLGVGLLIIGVIGTFFANWIKAAVSRQREYLADASAVQYTRNPNGLGGALARIRDSFSTVSSAGAEEASHMFFGSIKSYLLFATHPPIDERIARLGAIHIEPRTESKPAAASEIKERIGKPGAQDFMMAAAVLSGVSAEARAALNKPKAAMELVIGMLAKESASERVLGKLSAEVRAIVSKQTPEQALALFDLAVPALRRLEPMMAANFLLVIETMVKEDGVIQPLEIAMLSILRRLFEPKRKRPRLSFSAAETEAEDLLKCLARAGHPGDEEQARSAFGAGADHIALSGEDQEKAWARRAGSGLEIEAALVKLSALDPRDKSVLFEAIWLVVNHDKKLTAHEAQYLRAVSEALEIPLPPTALTS